MTPPQHKSIDRIYLLDGVRIWIEKRANWVAVIAIGGTMETILEMGITRYVKITAANAAPVEVERGVAATSAVVQVQQA